VASEVIKIPDLGGASDVAIVEVAVSVGDELKVDDVLVVLETDKASMEVPCPFAGRLLSLALKVGDQVAQGDVVGTIEVADEAGGDAEASAAAPSASASAPAPAPAPQPPAAAPAGQVDAAPSVIDVPVPDLGGADRVDVIEVGVKPGDVIAQGDTLIVLESDKASMEVPAPATGKVVEVRLQVGDNVTEGDVILRLEQVSAGRPVSPAPVSQPAPAAVPAAAAPSQPVQTGPAQAGPVQAGPIQAGPIQAGPVQAGPVHAGPAVRKLAREFGVDLGALRGTGPHARILKEDVQAWVKQQLQRAPAGGQVAGAGIPSVPEVDFAQFGPVRVAPMSKLQRLTAQNMHRSWLNVPRVTQFDEVDITDLEAFREEQKAQGVRLTPLPFMLKACAVALRSNPVFNASLAADGQSIVFKDYVHIGIAVATPAGLMVPVVRDVDRKSITELAAESAELALRAKDKKLKPQEMQGACFTISSLGNIGGTGFTPIVNVPEVAILGVSRLAVKPVWNGQEFVPRKLLPIALSYDHRAVNGADAGKFATEVGLLLSDIRRLLL